MENMEQGTICTKMGADSLAKNSPNAPEFVCPSSKVLNFNEKRLHWASVVRGSFYGQTFNRFALLKIVCSLRAALM